MLSHNAGQGQPLHHFNRESRRWGLPRAVRAVLAALLLAFAPGWSVAQESEPAGDDRLARQVEAFAEAYDLGHYEEAAQLGAVALAMSREAFGDDAQQTGFLMLNLARVHLRTGQSGKAAQLFGEARALFERSFGPAHPAVLDAELGLAAAAEVDDPAAAAVRYRAVVARMRAMPDSDPVMLANAEVGLAGALRRSGDVGAALDAYGAAADRFAASLGAFHPATVQTRAAWASLQPSVWVAADALFESWRALRASLGDAHPETVGVGLVAARSLLDLGAADAALEVSLPLAARAPEGPRDEAAAMVAEAWAALRDPDATVRRLRSASPPEDAEPRAKEAAAAYLATILIGFDRAVEAALAIDRARRLTGSLSTSGAQLAESLARIAEPTLAEAASLQGPDLLAEAAAIVDQLDPAHPRRDELAGLIALVRARRALAAGNPGEARAVARDALDTLTDVHDPRGVLRLRLRTAQAAAFFASGNQRLAAIAYNGLERDIAGAAKSTEAMAAGTGGLLLTPAEAIATLAACADFWREQPSQERLLALQAQIAQWQLVEAFWPAATPPPTPAD